MKKAVLVAVVLIALLAALAAILLMVLLGSRLWNASARPEGAILTFEIDREAVLAEESVDMGHVVAVVDRRLNPGRTSLARVRPVGPQQVEVVTFTTDPAELRRIERRVQAFGTLEFRVVANQRDHQYLIDRALEEEGRTVRGADGQLLAWWVEVQEGQEADLLELATVAELAHRSKRDGGRQWTEFLVVNDVFDVNGSYLIRAEPSVDAGCWKVLFTLNRRGGQLFGALTGENQPDQAQGFSRHLGIILDGKLHSAPAIRTTIFERGEITGNFTRKEVDDLVDVLNAGALPAPLVKMAERLPDAGP